MLLVAGIFTHKSAAQVILKADTVEVSCSAANAFLVPVRLDNFTNVSGLQFTLRWNPAHLDYAYTTSLHPQFLGVGFDTLPATVAQGYLTFAWTDLAGLSLPSNTVLFEVAFTRIGGPMTPISFSDDPTAVAVFDNMFDKLPHQTSNGAAKPLDNEPPSISCPSNVTVQAAGPTAIPNIAPNNVTDNCGAPAIGWASAGATVANAPNDPDASGAVFNIGASTVTYTATDAGNQTATCTFLVTVEFGVPSDELTILANSLTASCGDTISLDILAYNFDSIAGLQFSMEWLPTALQFVQLENLNNGLNIFPTNIDASQAGNGSMSFAWTSASIFGSSAPDGTVLFSIQLVVQGPVNFAFTDNPTARFAFTGTVLPPEEVPFTTLNAQVTVIDNQAPAISCPANITVQSPGPAAVQGLAPVVSDNCAAPNVGWSSTGATLANFPNDNDASGAIFNIGTSNVTYTATDAGGNTATCSFEVTVEFGINTDDLTIVASSPNAACGGNFSVDFTGYNFETVAGVQFTVTWNPALYQYTSVSNLNLPLGIVVTNFGLDEVGNGMLTFAWAAGDLNGLSVNDGTVLFTLNFSLLSNTSSGIVFADLPTQRFAFDGGTFDEIPMTTIDGNVTVFDNVAPSLTCPANVSVDAPQGQLFAQVNGLQPTLTDNCDPSPTLSYQQTGATTGSGNGSANGTYNAGTTTVIYTATDASGNTATCSFQVVVDAGTPLILSVPDADLGCQAAGTVTVCVTVENFTDVKFAHFWLNWDPATLDFVGVVNVFPGLNLNPSMFFNFADVSTGLLKFFGGTPAWPNIPDGQPFFCIEFNLLPNGTVPTNITFSGPIEAVDSNFDNVPVVTNNGSLTATADNEPPTVSCPPDITLTAPSNTCEADHNPAAPDATDNCGSIASIMRTPMGNTFQAGSTVVTYTVTDEAGNTNTCSLTITVEEDTPPFVIGCPTNPIVVNANANCQGNAFWSPPSFADVCSQSITVDNNFFPGNLFPLGVSTVIYEATDESGNKSTCAFDVEVRDNTAPTIVCPSDTVMTPIDGCAAVFDYTVSITDNCTQNIVPSSSHPSGSVFSGVTPVTVTAADAAGNTSFCTFSVIVADVTPPVFDNGCPPDITVTSASGNCGANPTWPTPMATDNCTPNIAPISAPASGSFMAAQLDPHVVTFTATDALGNTATCTFNVTVLDATPPVLTNCPSLPVFIVLPPTKCDTVLNWTPPTVNDNCGAGNVTLTSNFQPGTSFTTGDTMVVYVATDASGNSATCFFNVSIKDVIPPSFVDCPTQPITIQNGDPCGNVVNFTLPTGMDNCTPDNLLVYESSYAPGDIFSIGTTLFPVRVTDASGNFAECEIRIIVQGPAPAFLNIPNPAPVQGCQAAVTWIAPTPVGFCPPVQVTTTHDPGFIFPLGSTVVTYTATDSLGHIATATFVVTVTENVPPVFVCPVSPIVVNVGGIVTSDPSGFLQSVSAVPNCGGIIGTFGLPSATDNCVTPTVSQMEGPASGTLFPIGTNTFIFNAKDSSGNTATCAVFVQVFPLPDLNPMVSPNPACAGDEVTITAANIPGATYTWVGPVNGNGNMVLITSLNAQNDGDYIVTASINGCSTGPDTATVYLVLPPKAVNDLSFTINPGETVTFGSVLDNDMLTPAFDFYICGVSQLPGLVMNTADGTFTYTAGEDPGMVSFTYKVCSQTCNLEDQAAVTITINDTKCVFIPNIITPNGDDVNDWFTIPCIDTGLFRENSLVVFNQWGDKVYEAAPYNNAPNAAWRGTLNGQDGKNLPDGVYYYIFKSSPSAAPMKGFVEIFR
jgi:gliding motility-associated-like protein